MRLITDCGAVTILSRGAMYGRVLTIREKRIIRPNQCGALAMLADAGKNGAT
jgi:hypothetical protein